MIGFLRGEVLEVVDNRVLLLVGGVGYQVTLPQGAELGSLAVGSKLDVQIHTHVREDALDLYGFLKRADKELFLLLLGVNGIGPKGALAVLSGMSVGALVEAILSGNHGLLQKIPGVGKKTAERLVLELSDVLKKRPDLAAEAAGASHGAPAVRKVVVPSGVGFALRAFSDAQDALVQLGFRESDVITVLKRIETERADSGEALGAFAPEDLVKVALQQLR
jgi:Holliday junction DNA helicase RuvA